MMDHLWQSTAFAGLVALACWRLREHSPRLRYWLWLAASLKFLLPFAFLLEAGARFAPAPGHVSTPVLSAVRVEQATAVLMPAGALAAQSKASATPVWLWLWVMGAVAVAVWRARQWSGLARARRAARRVELDFPLPALATPHPVEPGLFGLWRPVLLLPEGLREKLDQSQLAAILAHERCHVRYRDNLTAGLHMLVEAGFWFHPLVWWIGARLVAERERHCDENVLAHGAEPEDYARGLVEVCRHFVATPLPCAAGVTGADLKERLRQILAARIPLPLSRCGQAVLVAAGLTVLAAPLIVGVLRAQTLPPSPAFGYEVASIRPAQSADGNSRIGPGPQGGIRCVNVTAMTLMGFAYDLREFQIAGAPGWASADRWDVSFTPDQPEVQASPDLSRDKMESMFNRQRQRMQAVLRDRFGLVLRVEKREQSHFALVQAKGGHKLKAAAGGPPHLRTSPGRVQGNGVYLNMVTNALSGFMGKQVVNETGLDGPFDLELEYPASGQGRAPDESDRAAVITAMPEQLGLRLEARKGPVSVYVVEKLAKPDAN